MRFFLQLALLVAVIAYGCHALSEEENSSSEEHHLESNKTDQNQDSNADSDSEEEEEEPNKSHNMNDHSKTALQSLGKNRGSQNDLASFSKIKGKKNQLEQNLGEQKKIQKNQDKRFHNAESALTELKKILENQNSNKQLKTALQKLTEIHDNQNDLKNRIGDQNSTILKEIKQVVQSQNRLLQNFVRGRRNLTVLGQTIEVLMESNGWIVIHSRFDGSVDFYRNWKDYRNGFGRLDGEFWLGLENIYALTATNDYELLIQMEDMYGKMAFARYKKFAIDGEDEGYKLKTLKSYSGTAGDSLTALIGQKFSTNDRGICILSFNGPWWSNPGCTYSHLNGIYVQKYTYGYIGWDTFRSKGLKSAKMLIREV